MLEEKAVHCTIMHLVHTVRYLSDRGAYYEHVLTVASRNDAMHLAFRKTARYGFATPDARRQEMSLKQGGWTGVNQLTP
jgi:hypothetical protein